MEDRNDECVDSEEEDPVDHEIDQVRAHRAECSLSYNLMEYILRRLFFKIKQISTDGNKTEGQAYKNIFKALADDII